MQLSRPGNVRGLATDSLILSLFRFGLDHQRRSLEIKGAAELVFEKALEPKMKLSPAICEKDERGRPDARLGHIVDLGRSRARRGGPVHIHRFQEAIQLARGDPEARRLMNPPHQREDLLHPLVFKRRHEMNRSVAEKLQFVTRYC